MSGFPRIAIIAAVVVFVPVLAIAVGVGGVASALRGDVGSGPTDCAAVGGPAAGLAGYRADQLANAATIVAVGTQLSVPKQGQVVAIVTALQESGLENLDHGDRDSLGLFQQRPSQGWGTRAQIMTPTYAATQFYRHLQAVPGWQQMSVTDAAQAVQHSAFPNAYGPHERTAREILAALAGSSCTTDPARASITGAAACDRIPAPSPAAHAAITYACRQRGVPYLWGGNGAHDGGFDCSGLTLAAYAAAGILLPRTADAQYRAGPHIPATQPPQPGDLVFYGTRQHVHHVGLYIGGGLMIDAPDDGAVVRIEPYREADFLGATRPAGAISA